MAVEKSKVIARLKALFPKANLSQQRLDAIADKLAKKPADDADETAIDAVINDFNDVLSIEDIARDDDRTRTLEADKKKAEELAKKSDDKSDKKDDVKIDGDVPAWAQAILDSNKKLNEDLEAIKAGKTIETKRQTASELFGKSEVLKNMKPELKAKWEKRIDIDSETSFEDQVKELESEYSELIQVSADSNQYAGAAGGGKSDVKASELDIDKIMNQI